MNDDKRKLLLAELSELADNYGLETDDIIDAIEYDEALKADNRLREEIAENAYLVGKTFRKKVKPYSGIFPRMYRYYKVVSERSDRSGDVSCLVFDEFPHYWYEYQAHKRHMTGDYLLGYYKFCPIWSEGIPVKNTIIKKGIESMEEINPEMFDTEMDKLVARIKDMKWVADHYRWGGKLPTDEDWEK
ncbi:MAG: hypothetical protein K5669_03690 [Lachnospiraceae bacterium]|nr:hypothetical protein [Lachnospiraceae bacterium]